MKKPFYDCPICNKVNELNKKETPGVLTVCNFCATMIEFDKQSKPQALASKKFLAMDDATRYALNELVYTIVNKRT